MTLESQSALNELFAHPALGAEGIEVARGTILFDQGDVAENVFYIHRGQVRLTQISANGDERLIEILGPGQWFGCASLSHKGKYTTRAIAAAPGQVSRVDAQKLLAHAVNNPTAAATLIQYLANTIQNAREDAARLQFQDCNQRLIEAMLRFSETAAATTQGSDVVLHLTHAQLAQAVGAARETVSLALTELRQKNLVRTGRNRLIFNREQLREASGLAQKN